MLLKLSLASVLAISLSTAAYSQCLSLVNGPIHLDKTTCSVVKIPDHFAAEVDPNFYKNLTATDRDQFNKSYQGMLIKGHVSQSEAIQAGISKTKGALFNENIAVFVRSSIPQCKVLENKLLAIQLAEKCCTGLDTPCALGTSYFAKKVKVLPPTVQKASNPVKAEVQKTPAYNEAQKAFAQKKYKLAIDKYKAAEPHVDLVGYYHMALAYRQLEQCQDAIPILEKIYATAEKGNIWADQIEVVQRVKLLLARCHSKQKNSGRATVILNALLVQPKQHEALIKASLRHKDFGWIRTTKDWIQYRKNAIQTLKNLAK